MTSLLQLLLVLQCVCAYSERKDVVIVVAAFVAVVVAVTRTGITVVRFVLDVCCCLYCSCSFRYGHVMLFVVTMNTWQIRA